jgi:AraC-like DNA-binding protein
MFDNSSTGVLYTEYSRLTATTLLGSLWSYESHLREPGRRCVTDKSDGTREYWLERSDPLLNTILPGTGVSLVVNFGDIWTSGQWASTKLPRVCVIGPVTRAEPIRLGNFVDGVGAGFSSIFAPVLLNVAPSELVDRILPLQDLWHPAAVERLFESLYTLRLGSITRCVSLLKDELLARAIPARRSDAVAHTALQDIQAHAGQVFVDEMARNHQLSRQQFAHRFRTAAGLPPKLFARITRFQALLHALLSTDVSRWTAVAVDMGFYDQAHMINEFRTFAGSSPIAFFRSPDSGDYGRFRLHGRPSDWLREPSELSAGT